MRFSSSTVNELFRMALPMVASQGAFAVMMFADRFFLSRISPVHVAASLGGGVSFWVCLCFFNGIAAYSNALVAQYYGRKEFARCPQVMVQGILLSLACQPILIFLAWFWVDVFEWMGHTPDLVSLERPFFQCYMFASIVFLIKTVLASYFSGIGRTQVVMIADVAGVLANLPLSYALIFGRFGLPELGIIGAALGTICAALLTIVIYLFFILQRTHADKFRIREALDFRPIIMRRYVRLGLPSGFEIFIGLGTFNVFLLLFQSYGVAEGAAMAIVFNWDMLCFVPLMGLNIAVMSLVGRRIGAGDLERTGEVVFAGFLLGISYAGVLGLIFLLFRESLLRVFSVEGQDFSAILSIGAPMMVGMSTYVIGDALILVCGGVLRGAGDTHWLMKTSTAIHIVMLVIQVFVILIWQLGPLTSWYVFVATIISKAIVYLIRVLGGSWRTPQRIAAVLAD